MKKLIFTLFLSCAFFTSLFAQVTTEPYFITTDFADEFVVIYDASQGNGVLKGTKECYAHTGVITNKSTGDSDWKHGPTWGDNSPKYKMVNKGNDIWELTITGGMKEYYGLKEGEQVKKLAFVFRNKAGNKVGKTATEGDIFYELYDPAGGVHMHINSPVAGNTYTEGDEFDCSVILSQKAEKIELLANGTSFATENNSNAISAPYVCNASGDLIIKVVATVNGVAYEESLSLYVFGKVIDKKVPAWMKEGINYKGDENNTVGLVFRAPESKSLYVLGDFNNWEINENFKMFRDIVNVKSKLDPQKDSINTILWWTEFQVENPTQFYTFQYLVDGKLQVSDPYSEVILDPWEDKYIVLEPALRNKYPKKGDGLVSVLRVLNPNAYEWEVTDFQAPAKEDLSIYELHVRDFAKNHKLSEVISRLDYLKDLGINAIELMPIQEFDGNNSWGYNPNHYFAYDKAYGTERQYKQFIDECHKRGIAVILDMVFNHATGQCPLAKLYWGPGSNTSPKNPWFNVVARHPFNVFHDFNHEYEGTRSYFKRVLEYWIKEYKVDGYRMDLSKGFTQKYSSDAGQWSKYDASRIVILKDYYDAVKATKENAYFILEHLGEYKEEKELSDYGMLPWRNMNWNYNNAAKGNVGGANFVDHNGKGGMFADGWVGYAESHDEERNFYEAKAWGNNALKNKPEVYLKRVPAVIAFAQLIPGAKMMWQFGEMGYDYSINYCMNGKISDECRTYEKPIPWNLKWDEDPLRMEAYEGSSKVINLRTKYPEFFKEQFVTVTRGNGVKAGEAHRIDVRYQKPAEQAEWEEDIDIIILANFDAVSSIMTNANFSKTGIWYDYMTGEQIPVKRLNKTLTLQPGELLILTSRALDGSVDVEDTLEEQTACQVLPTITNDLITVIASQTPQSILVYNLSGQLVAANQNSETISLAGLNRGTYLVRVVLGDTVSSHKIIKK